MERGRECINLGGTTLYEWTTALAFVLGNYTFPSSPAPPKQLPENCKHQSPTTRSSVTLQEPVTLSGP